jgi:CheY-like chemotaxis protein
MDKANDPQAPGGLRILIVDDSADTTEMAALALAVHGYQVRTAPDGPTALRMVQEQRPDVILLDIGLPQVDGWEVARRLRELTGPEAKPPVLIAISGYGGAEIAQCSQAAGINLHLVKPVDMDELRQLLSRLLLA